MSFTHWYDEPPYRVARYDSPLFDYDIPAIIQAVREEERKETTVRTENGADVCNNCDNDYGLDHANFCPHCGLRINWE